MDSRSLQFFTQVYSAFEKKTEYEKELREYESKSGLGRLTSRRPADPLQGFSLDELRELLPYSLECAVPELAFEHVAGDGSRVEASFRLIADEGGDSRLITRLNDYSRRLYNVEFFELEPGEGFVHGYTDDADVRRHVRNISYSEKLAVSSRMFGLGQYVKDYFCVLDDFRRSPAVADLASGRLQDLDRSVIESVRQRKDFSDSQKRIRDAGLAKLARSSSVRTVRDLVSCRFGELSTRALHARCDEYEKLFKVLSNGVYARNVREADAVMLYNDARHGQSAKGWKSLSELMAASQEQASALLSDRQSALYHRKALGAFVENALDYGYDVRDIDREVNRYLNAQRLGDDFRPAYDIIVAKQAGNYIAVILEQTDTAYGKGLRDAAKVEIQTPVGSFEQRMEEVSDFKRANGFLISENQQASHEILSGGEVSHQSAVALGRALAASGAVSSPGAVAKLCGISADWLCDGYYTALAAELVSGAPVLAGSGVRAVDALAGDIALAASCAARKDVALAGSLLRDAGVVLNVDGLAGGIVAAAAAMHADGGLLASCRVTDFRRKWSEFISESRMSGERIHHEVKNTLSFTQKRKLF